MADPEVQRILKDPVMNQILKELQENPASAVQHLQSPEIYTKLMKLQRGWFAGGKRTSRLHMKLPWAAADV